MWVQPVMAVCGVVPVAAIMPVFPSIVHIPALQRDHYCVYKHRVIYNSFLKCKDLLFS